MESDLLNTRVACIQESARRTRKALLVASVISATILITIWNLYFTWDTIYFASPTMGAEAPNSVKPTGTSTDVGRLRRVRDEQTAKNFTDNWTISISLLGIRVSGSDLSILGCCTLFFASLYLTLCSRRENHEVGSLFCELRNAQEGERRLAYFGVRGSMVFISVTSEDRAFTTLEPPGESPASSKRASSKLLRYPMGSLSFLPSFAAIAVLLSDVYFALFYWSDNMRRWDEIAKLEGNYQARLVWLDVIGALLLVAIVVYNRQANSYHRGIISVMRAFKEKFETDFGRPLTSPTPDVAAATSDGATPKAQ
ncbi:MAG: hypothetical protein U0Q16_37740 [Bryobacteraceae bacterium]